MNSTPGQLLKRDLAPFADPATDIKLTESSKTSRLQLVRNGLSLDYLLLHDDLSLLARHAGDKKIISVRSLLASPEFADIRNLVATQNRIYRDFDVETLIPPEGELDGRKFALQTFSRLITPSQTRDTNQGLRVILLDGPAGVGKTSLIQRLLVQRARAAQDSSTAPPILQIESRGKRLSSLDDVLAQSLQLIRARFTFDQLPSLIRHGLIQLAIDGFDELVDSEGYRDAWFALRDFFETTMYGGPIILAGRDTFFDEQKFAAQIGQSNQASELNHARLSEVSPTSAKKWLALRGWSQKELEDSYTDLVLRPGSYTLRPYFLHELAKAGNWSNIESRDLTPRAYLVEQFLDRECRILSEKVEIVHESLKTQLTSIFEEVAVEMADTESDVVDLSFLQMATELAFAEFLSTSDVAKLRHKSGSFALLASDAREGFRRFPHSEISYHFLSRALLRIISTSEPIRFLRRGILGSDLLAIFAENFLSSTDTQAGAFVVALERNFGRESTFDRLPDNTASLLLTSLCREVSGRSLSYCDMQASNVFFFGDVSSSRLERIKIQRLDAAEASLVALVFKDCEIVNLHVDETTRFGTTAPMVHQLHLKTPKGAVRSTFDPEEISSWIKAHSANTSTKKAENFVALALLDKVCRVMLRQHMIKDHDTDAHGKLLRVRYWAEIEQILSEADMLNRLHGKNMAGTNAPLVRMKDPFSLLANRSGGAFGAVWKKVAAIPE